MIEPVVHECPGGSRFRISRIQALRGDPCFEGVVMTYLVEPEATSTASDDEAVPEGSGDVAEAVDAGSGATMSGAASPPPLPGFRVVVRFAPIFMSILSPDDRRRLEARATALIEGLLDRGVRDDATVDVTSDGAVRLDGAVVARQLSLSRGAA